jgi:ABC-type multidrug transport system fused ATPase/permease subunit
VTMAVITVAHRLLSVAFYDQVLVLDHGRVVQVRHTPYGYFGRSWSIGMA